ncbi:uncharacterized protein Triagg1_7262 [Trichoderma aggressivum f. europaeum]|uniref:F-box domain-containing protein n=1 Tax=Trichoderma aggressivum f. europaeum TaxID=173218 RepID=A0AAE1IBP0_9HYPO|nr:hypothetical protein Triagg1_7262 [Trichoderma aggressivum f. europaeum]
MADDQQHEQFQLIAPQFERYAKLRGTPGEMLFNWMGEEIEQLVAIPIQRQSVSPRLDMAISLGSASQPQNECQAAEATAGGSLQETQEKSHLKRKANSEERPDSSGHQQRAKTKPSDANTNPATFSNLPTELLRLIFDHIFPMKDVVSLALASRRLWAVGRVDLHEHYASYFGNWAGQKMLFVGDDVEPKDYPPGLFSAEELAELPEVVDIPYN